MPARERLRTERLGQKSMSKPDFCELVPMQKEVLSVQARAGHRPERNVHGFE